MLPLVLLTMLSQAPSQAPSLSQGRTYVKWLLAGEAGKVWKAASPSLKERFPTLEAVSKFASGARSYGTETRLVTESLSQRDGVTVYKRVMAVSNYARGMQLEISMDDAARISNLSIDLANQAAPTVNGAYRSLIPLRLPCEGAWFVLWGGRSFDDNKHASVSDMRYALDLLIYRNGNTFAGSGARNDDYFAWRLPVLAPGGGTIVEAEDGVLDNQPNRPVPGNLYGNYVVIDHGTGEYSLLAHMAQGSVKVRVGEVVSAGQPLGRVGNSGMSTEPHIHYHLMDNASWKKAQGLPAQFQFFNRNGQLVDRGEPRRGDTIAQSEVEARR
jgi:murein DD-endopeptidase MepM/ murein hydrolase activator NlpD